MSAPEAPATGALPAAPASATFAHCRWMGCIGQLEHVTCRLQGVGNALDDDHLAGLEMLFVFDQDLTLSHRGKLDRDPGDAG